MAEGARHAGRGVLLPVAQRQPELGLQYSTRTAEGQTHRGVLYPRMTRGEHDASVGSVFARVRALAGAWLAGEWFGERGQRLPLGPFLLHGSLAAALSFSVRAELGPFPYAVFALSLPLVLATLPLLGELAPLLRADPAWDWIAAQPVRPSEIRLARIACIVVLLGALVASSLVPAVLLAPASLGTSARLILLAAGMAQALLVAAILLLLQALFGRRLEGLLVLLQTALFCAMIVGAVAGLRHTAALARLEDARGLLALYPPAAFASLVLDRPFQAAPLASAGAIGATLAALVALVLVPFPPPLGARSTRSPLSILLSPLRALATRLWVRPEERASFDLVYDGLPAERDFVMRAYPLLAVPLAFLLLGGGADDPQGEGLLALLAFTPAIYLPVLLVHVPATATPLARWLLDTAPLDPNAEREGTIKAIAVRFLAPLYLALLAVQIARGSLDLALRLLGPALVAGLVTLRVSHASCVSSPPLSLAVQDLPSAFRDSFSGTFITLAVVHTLLAILCWRFVATPSLGLSILAVVVGIELLVHGRALRPARS